MSKVNPNLTYMPRPLGYIIFYFFMFLCLIGSFVFLLYGSSGQLPDFLPWGLLHEKSAMESAISVLGSTGLAVAWLIPILPQKVHGIRIINLVRWSAPGFFFAYFTIFIPTLMISILAANMPDPKGEDATAIAFFGIIVGSVIILYKCRDFVFHYPKREIIAYSYYKFLFENLDPQRQDLTLQKKGDPCFHELPACTSMRRRWIMFWEAVKGRHPQSLDLAWQSPTEQQRLCEENLLRLAQDLAESEIYGADMNEETVIELINICFKTYKSLLQPENASSHSEPQRQPGPVLPVPEVKCIFLAKRFWSVVLDAKFNKAQRAHVVVALASQCDASDTLLSGLILELYQQAELASSAYEKRDNIRAETRSNLLWLDLGEQISTWIAEAEFTGGQNAAWLKKFYLRYIWMMQLDYSYNYRDAGCSFVRRLARRLDERARKEHIVDSAFYEKEHPNLNGCTDVKIVETVLDWNNDQKNGQMREEMLRWLAIAHAQAMWGENDWNGIKRTVQMCARKNLPPRTDECLKTWVEDFIRFCW